MQQKAIGFVNPIEPSAGRNIQQEIQAIKDKARELHLELVDILGWATMNGPVAESAEVRNAETVKRLASESEARTLILSTGQAVISFPIFY